MTDAAANTRCGVTAVLGAPNAGKSTLVNRLVGAKVSIVSPKAQTTRTRVLGVAIEGQSQIILLDTPGVFAPRRRLDRAMVDAAWRAAGDADAALLLVDAKRGIDEETRGLIAGLHERKIETALALNKIDIAQRPKLLALAAELNGLHAFTDTYMISAETGDGVGDLKKTLAARMPEGPFLYPEDEITDLTERLLAAEVTREHAFRQLHEELPYGLAVETEQWEDLDDGSARIHQTIYVRKENHKRMVIGAKGARIKELGAASRDELGKMLDRRIHLMLHVKVVENWDEKRDFYRLWGLQYEV
jgi:GTP-binding protein Era